MAKSATSGRGGGSRDSTANTVLLTGRYLDALAEDFAVNGKDAVERAREKDPIGYLRAIAALLPKDVIADKPTDGLSDDELATIIAAIRELRATLQQATGRQTQRMSGNAAFGGSGQGRRGATGRGAAAEGARNAGNGAGETGKPQPARGLPAL